MRTRSATVSVLIIVIALVAGTHAAPRDRPCELLCSVAANSTQKLPYPLLPGILDSLGYGYEITSMRRSRDVLVELCCDSERNVLIQRQTYVSPDDTPVTVSMKDTQGVQKQALDESMYQSIIGSVLQVKPESSQSLAAQNTTVYKTTLQYVQEDDKVYTQTQNIKSVYTASLGTGVHPLLSLNFMSEMKALPTDYEQQDYFDFLNRFGTFFAYSVEYGGTITQKVFTDRTYYDSYGSAQVLTQAKYEFEVSVNSDTAKQKPDASFLDASLAQEVVVYGGNEKTQTAPHIVYPNWSLSVADKPRPITLQLHSIVELFDETWTGIHAVDNLDEKRANMQKALDDYYANTEVCQDAAAINYNSPLAHTNQCVYTNVHTLMVNKQDTARLGFGHAPNAQVTRSSEQFMCTMSHGGQGDACTRLLVVYTYTQTQMQSGQVLRVFGGVYTVRGKGHDVKCEAHNKYDALDACACPEGLQHLVFLHERDDSGLFIDNVMCVDAVFVPNAYTIATDTRVLQQTCAYASDDTLGCACARDYEPVLVFSECANASSNGVQRSAYVCRIAHESAHRLARARTAVRAYE